MQNGPRDEHGWLAKDLQGLLGGAHLCTGIILGLAQDVESANENARFPHALIFGIIIREPQAPTTHLATVLDGALVHGLTLSSEQSLNSRHAVERRIPAKCSTFPSRRAFIVHSSCLSSTSQAPTCSLRPSWLSCPRGYNISALTLTCLDYHKLSPPKAEGHIGKAWAFWHPTMTLSFASRWNDKG